MHPWVPPRPLMPAELRRRAGPSRGRVSRMAAITTRSVRDTSSALPGSAARRTRRAVTGAMCQRRARRVALLQRGRQAGGPDHAERRPGRAVVTTRAGARLDRERLGRLQGAAGSAPHPRRRRRGTRQRSGRDGRQHRRCGTVACPVIAAGRAGQPLEVVGLRVVLRHWLRSPRGTAGIPASAVDQGFNEAARTSSRLTGSRRLRL